METFTKKELIDIAEAIDGWYSDLDADWPETLYLKVRDMISDYCEHEDYKSVSDVDCIKTCCDCGEILDWD